MANYFLAIFSPASLCWPYFVCTSFASFWLASIFPAQHYSFDCCSLWSHTRKWFFLSNDVVILVVAAWCCCCNSNRLFLGESADDVGSRAATRTAQLLPFVIPWLDLLLIDKIDVVPCYCHCLLVSQWAFDDGKCFLWLRPCIEFRLVAVIYVWNGNGYLPHRMSVLLPFRFQDPGGVDFPHELCRFNICWRN